MWPTGFPGEGEVVFLRVNILTIGRLYMKLNMNQINKLILALAGV